MTIVLLWVLSMVFSTHTNAQDTSLVYDAVLNTSFVRFVEDDQIAPISDEEFLDQSGSVVFPVNDYHLPPDAPLLKQLEDYILPFINRSGYELLRMYIRGAASPEGSYENNKLLGSRRVESLVNFVKSRVAFPVKDESFNLDVEYEDYRSLAILLSRASDMDASYVQDLCDKYLPDNRIAELKAELKAAQGGRLWQRLLKTYFPKLRVVRLILFFRKAQPVAAKPGAGSLDLSKEPVVEQKPVVVKPVIEPVAEPVEPQQQILPRREFLSVKTNLLFDVAYMPGYNRWCPIPNVALEYYPKKGHFTFGASFDFPWWQDYDAQKYFQIRNYQLESRYYFRSGNLDANPLGEGAAFRGFYLQGYGNIGLFGICFDADRGWVGEGFGAGIGLGYVTQLSKKGHWRLEFGLQAGFFRCKYDPYQYENPVDPTYRDHLYYYKWTQDPELFKKRQYRYTWLGPTRIGVTLTYDLLYRRINKNGVSFKNKEEITR